MKPALSEAGVAAAFREACLRELDALKPGNVHRFASGHRLEIAQFEQSAAVAAPFIANSRLGIGARIRKAAQATALSVRTNTNLGILLLAAPLATAAQTRGEGDLKARLSDVLDALTIEDAAEAYAGIRLANAGGLGQVGEHDIAEPPRITLLEAMEAAEGRDRIAWNYTHQFADIFDNGLPRLEAARRHFEDPAWATAEVYLGFLASLPDTLIRRRFGPDIAEEVRLEAVSLSNRLMAVSDPEPMKPELLAFDRSLKLRALNPGTSADFTVATLFTEALQRDEKRND